MKLPTVFFLSFLAACGLPAQASTIVAELSGPFAFSASAASPDPFGSFDYVVASWSQTSSFTNISVSFLGTAVFQAATGTAYLTTSFGSGTTIADQLDSAAFSIPFGPASQSVTLFSGLDLGPGTYYVTIAADSGDEIGWNATNSPAITTAPGASVNSGMACFNGESPAPYPPGVTGDCSAANVLFTVASSPASVPEPSTFSMFVVCAAALAWRKWKPRRA